MPCPNTNSTSAVPDGTLRAYYRYAPGMVDVEIPSELQRSGFFRLGSASCFGSCRLDSVAETIHTADEVLPDAALGCVIDASAVRLPFSPDEIAYNLRHERYTRALTQHRKRLLHSAWARQAYYLTRKLLPLHVRKHLQRPHLADWQRLPFPNWPVDCSVELMFEELMVLALQARPGSTIPFVWFWPANHAGCVIMTHDVEEGAGRDFCPTLMDLDERAGLRSSFQIIPEERYHVVPRLLEDIRSRGHEVNIHDLNHDGHLFREREEFLRRAMKINAYAHQYCAEGFRSAILYRNLDWYGAFEFDYDMSVPNTARLDPQRGGCCTVMPYFIGRLVELPLTMTQDYSLFHILQQYSTDLWEAQIDRVLRHYGLISFNIHPDYIIEKRARAIYERLLTKLASIRDKCHVWAALPREVNRWWRQRSQMQLVECDGTWRVVGEGSERASVGYALIDDGKLVYDYASREYTSVR